MEQNIWYTVAFNAGWQGRADILGLRFPPFVSPHNYLLQPLRRGGLFRLKFKITAKKFGGLE